MKSLFLLPILAFLTCSVQIPPTITTFKFVSAYSIIPDSANTITITGILFCDTVKTTVTEDYAKNTITVKSGKYVRKFHIIRNLNKEHTVWLLEGSDSRQLLLLKDKEDWFIQTPTSLMRLSKTPHPCAK